MKRSVSIIVIVSLLAALATPLSATRYYDSGIGRWLVPDKAGQYWSPYVYCGNNPVIYVDENGDFAWFIPMIAFGMGYMQHGITTNQWGADALMSGLIAGTAVTAGMLTGGAAAGLMGFAEGSAGFGISAATIGGAVGGATGSIGGQLYFNGRIDWNQVGTSALIGSAGGLAGGFSGQYLTSDPVLTSMIGGAVGGGIEGSLHGNFGQGAFMGAWWGGLDGAVTSAAYDAYGRYLTKKNFPKGVDDALSCHDFKDQYLEVTGTDEYVSFETGFESPNDIPFLDIKKGTNWVESHSGISLGNNKYGQAYILSKLGPNRPVAVKTSTYFLKTFSNPRYNLYIPNVKMSGKARMLYY